MAWSYHQETDLVRTKQEMERELPAMANRTQTNACTQFAHFRLERVGTLRFKCFIVKLLESTIHSTHGHKPLGPGHFQLL